MLRNSRTEEEKCFSKEEKSFSTKKRTKLHCS